MSREKSASIVQQQDTSLSRSESPEGASLSALDNERLGMFKDQKNGKVKL